MSVIEFKLTRHWNSITCCLMSLQYVRLFWLNNPYYSNAPLCTVEGSIKSQFWICPWFARYWTHTFVHCACVQLLVWAKRYNVKSCISHLIPILIPVFCFSFPSNSVQASTLTSFKGGLCIDWGYSQIGIKVNIKEHFIISLHLFLPVFFLLLPSLFYSSACT